MPTLLQLHLLIFILAITGVFGKIAQIEAPTIVFWRSLIGALTMLLVLLTTQRNLLSLPPKRILQCLGIGFIIACHWICFFLSITLANLSVALAGLASVSLFTAFTESWQEKRPAHKNEILIGGLVFLGILIIIGLETQYLLGISVALLSAFLAALFPVWNRALVRDGISARSILLYEMSAACLSCTLLILLIPHPLFTFQSPNSTDWLIILLLAIPCTVIAYTWHITLLKKITAYTSNLAFNFEPIYGIILGALLFHEYQYLHPGFYLGTFIIIAANFLQPFLEKKSDLI